MNKNTLVKYLADEQQTLAFGAELALACGDTAVIYLHGDLGAGKTTLTRGFLRGLGFTGKVKSPSYALVEPYEVNSQKIFHFDFYRLHDPSELEYIGLPDYFIPQAICLVEWPQNGGELLPQEDLSCYIETQSNGRQIRLEACSPNGQKILERLGKSQASV
jgi:tRNA threonylcarbamoyladenosine biosynthesis protein TsaE